MGQYVTREDPKTGQDRKYYKADDGKLYSDYNAAAKAYSENKINEVMGVNATIIDPSTDPSLVRAVAPVISESWGSSHYANPLNSTIAIDAYKPGSQPYLEAHEAGHLSNEDAGPAKLLGVSGRAVTGISDRLGNPAPLELVGGFLTRTFDAEEEDRAERLSAKYGPQLGGDPNDAPVIDSEGRSEYGNSLREQGNQRMAGAASPIMSVIDTAKNFVQGNQRAGLEPEITQLTASYRTMLNDDNSIGTPEFQKIDQRLKELQKQYNSQGGDFDQFVGNI